MAKKKPKYSDEPVVFDKEKLFNICKTDLLKMICEAVSLVAHGNNGVDAFFLKGDKNTLIASQTIIKKINGALEQSRNAKELSFDTKKLSKIFFINDKTAQEVYENFIYAKTIKENYHQATFNLFLEKIRSKYADNFGTEIEKALKSIGKSGKINFVAHSYTKTCSFQNVNKNKTIAIEAKIDWESYTVIISGEDKKYTISLFDVPKFWQKMAKITPDDGESEEVVKDSRQTDLFSVVSLNKVIEIDEDAFEPFDKGDYKEFADKVDAFLRQYWRSENDFDTIKNTQSGFIIGFDNVGIKELANARRGETKMKALSQIKRIIEDAILFEVREDKKEAENILAIYKFLSFISYKGQTFEYQFVVKHKAQGKFIYAVNLDIRKPLN